MDTINDMLRLKGVRIKNFRAIRDANIPLDPQLTVLIGDNATGKTAILEAIVTALRPLLREIYSTVRREPEIVVSDFSVETRGDLLGEPYRAQFLSIELDARVGEIGAEYRLDEQYVDRPKVRVDRNRAPIRYLTDLLEGDSTAPILAFYRDDRGHLANERSRLHHRPSADRRSAYQAAFGGRLIFEDAISWFEDAENAELREQRERGPAYRDTRLDAVRRAVEALIPEVSNLRMLGRPPQLTMTMRNEGQAAVLVTADQLSSGFRVMLALVMDLARRMADLNPHLHDPLASPGIVLIDEVDLHLHPRWQQLVVKGLLAAFPNVQFVMTTHSPQVLTTLREHNILRLQWLDDKLTLVPVPSTEGAESGRMLTSAMGVSERPPADVSQFVADLERYLAWLKKDEADTPAAKKVFERMQATSPDDPILATLNLEKRRRAARKS
ncbi:AAA family ATPase [Blastomonas sp.]|uniref:AAA family ATPase n=1 Tax=Blastomonas sp. TaxID=1909299 RepID=UPI0039199265